MGQRKNLMALSVVEKLVVSSWLVSHNRTLIFMGKENVILAGI